jgi:deoxyribodipyrimidine photo-lyase
MRQLARTGGMPNRVRMITASYLVKDLGIDWRRGESLFAQRLNDFELASNNGNWQWVASTGCDAQPYFRIFNPLTQSRKFDPDGGYIRRFVPEVAGLSTRDIHAPWLASADAQRASRCIVGSDYPAPIVDHAEARERTLARYALVRELDGVG